MDPAQYDLSFDTGFGVTVYFNMDGEFFLIRGVSLHDEDTWRLTFPTLEPTEKAMMAAVNMPEVLREIQDYVTDQGRD